MLLNSQMTVDEWLDLPESKQHDYLKLVQTFNSAYFQKLWLEAWEETHERELVEKFMIHHLKPMISNPHKFN